jgi:ERCC4-related helicase
MPDAGLAPGAQILVRDEVWLVRNLLRTEDDGDKIQAVGVSELVRDQEATFFTGLDTVEPLRPERTRLVADRSPRFRIGRMFLEAVLRKTPLPQSETRLAMAEGFLLRRNPYQQRPAELALAGLRPRILIADVVGLGKTLEIGLTLAELIRRGRGERILVVTPQQVLDQFQRELWTRFAIPLIRLDSVGIQRIQREIPAGRNPFTYYRRVIISIDTLKSVGQYRHHLEKIHWDAVVIDESHNLAGSSSLRQQLAQVLAPRTDALLLASATPHNGDRKSFAQLIELLDPAAIADKGDYRAEDIAHLYVRRTKVNPEVRDHIHGNWADRGPSVPVRCEATEPEERIFAELTEHWLAPDAALATGRDRRLFPYVLLKSFLSSHRALADTVQARLKSLPQDASAEQVQRAALVRLGDLAERMSDEDSAKLTALVDLLRRLGVGPRSDTRVVVFSERVSTLTWLASTVPAKLGFVAAAEERESPFRVVHGGMPDTKQHEAIDDFGLQSNPVRLLFTGDVASEGVNLHQQCHHLIHYDLPWSLIRIEQRNGRIDRYGQEKPPQFTALILTSAHPGAKDDTTVAEKLLAREAAAHATLGTAETVTGLYNAREEEDRLTRALLEGRTVEESLADSDRDDLMAGLLEAGDLAEVRPEPEQVRMPSLFGSTEQFVDEAIGELYGAGDALKLRREDRVLILTPPEDLRRRLSVLPPSYLAEHRVNERLRLTFDRDVAEYHFARAVRKERITWPRVGYASDLHPVVEWLVDKLLARLGRQEAPVLVAEVGRPVVLVQGVYSNAFGRPTVVDWMAVTGLPDRPEVRDMFTVLAQAGVRPEMVNTGLAPDLDPLQALVPAAVEVGRRHLAASRDRWDEQIAGSLRAHMSRLERWEQLSLEQEATGRVAARRRHVHDTATDQRRLADSLRTSGAPFLRVLAVLAAAR